MQNKARGVVARKKGYPAEVVDMLVPDAGPGGALVEAQACGDGPTDLLYREDEVEATFDRTRSGGVLRSALVP